MECIVVFPRIDKNKFPLFQARFVIITSSPFSLHKISVYLIFLPCFTHSYEEGCIVCPINTWDKCRRANMVARIVCTKGRKIVFIRFVFSPPTKRLIYCGDVWRVMNLSSHDLLGENIDITLFVNNNFDVPRGLVHPQRKWYFEEKWHFRHGTFFSWVGTPYGIWW